MLSSSPLAFFDVSSINHNHRRMETKTYYYLDSYTSEGQFETRAKVVLWNDTDGKVETHQTYGWTDYGQGEVERISDESLRLEIQAKVKAWEQSEFERKSQDELERLQGKADEFNTLAPYQKKGQTVVLLKGKNSKFEGVVFWEGMDRFDRDYSSQYTTATAQAIGMMADEFCNPYKGSKFTRIGVKNDQGEVVWTKPSNVQVTDGFEAKEPTLDEAKSRVKRDQSNWKALENRY